MSIRNEIEAVIHSPWDIAMFVLMPVIWCLLIAGLFGQGLMRDIPVGIVNLDHHPESIELESRIDAIPSVKLISCASPLEAERGIKRGELYAYMVIPDSWLDRSAKPQGSAIELYFPKTLYAIGTTLELDIKQTLLAYQNEKFTRLAQSAGLTGKQAERAASLIRVNAVTLGNIGFKFQADILPTLIPGILHLALTLAVASRLLCEWRDRKVKQWVDAADGSALIAFLGKAIPWFVY